VTRIKHPRSTYTGHRTAWIYLPLGTWTLAAVILGLLYAEDVVWFFLLCGLPALFLVWVTLVGGFASAATRISLSDEGVAVRAPTWRGTPLLPLQRLTAAWSDIISVRRRTEIYAISGMGGFPVPAWELKTRSGAVVFGGRMVPGLPDAMAEIARRANVPIVDEGPIQVRLVRALLHGTPEWASETR
jgi:hypothetical protein